MKKNFYYIVTLLFLGLLLTLPTGFALAAEDHEPEIKSFDTLSGNIGVDFYAYSKNFKGGVSLAAGNITGNSLAEIVTVSGPGGRVHLRGFDSSGQFNGFSVFPFHPDYRGGGDVALGDIDGDGVKEVIVAANSQSDARVKVYDGNGQVVSSFLAFNSDFKGGVYVTAGDINNDGKDEVIVGAAAGGGPQVRVFNGYGHYLGIDFFPFSDDFRGGVDVAAADFDGDGQDEVLMSPATRAESRVKVYEADQTIISNFLAFSSDYQDGVRVAGGDIDKDGAAEVIVAPASNKVPEVRSYETDGQKARFNKVVYSRDFVGGVDVAAADLTGSGRDEILTAPQRFVWEGRRDLAKYIDIDLTNQKLYVYENGRKIFDTVISSGRPGMATPTGTFHVMRKEEMHWSAKYALWMPNSMQFTSAGHYIHRLPEWPGGYVEGENHLGMRVSHGCVRVGYDEAPILYNMVEVGTPIVIHY